MKVVSVSVIKGTYKGPIDDKPKDKGLRSLYDRLRTGEKIKLTPEESRKNYINKLVDFYGMEVEQKQGCKNGYVRLIGEWYGMEFVPIEKILQEEHFREETKD